MSPDSPLDDIAAGLGAAAGTEVLGVPRIAYDVLLYPACRRVVPVNGRERAG